MDNWASTNLNGQIITMTSLDTPLGSMIACAVDQGICVFEFADTKNLEPELFNLSTMLNATIVQGKSPHFDTLKKEVAEYFEGIRKEFSFPLYTPGSLFQQSVWNVLKTIPFGSTRSYEQQSLMLNNVKAIRAVASANGMNRIAIVIPCHRIIGKDGSLTGYAGGLWRKKWLLDFEAAHNLGPKNDPLSIQFQTSLF